MGLLWRWLGKAALRYHLFVNGAALASDRAEAGRLLKSDAAHGLTVSPPNCNKLTMRINSLKTLDLILSLSKDEAKISGFFSSLPAQNASDHDAGSSLDDDEYPL
jgi:hypothetical protein